MIDGIETDRAAVLDQYIIKRLNLCMPFSPTDGEIKFADPLVPANYKGIHVYGKLRSGYETLDRRLKYWFRLRGSLIKVANQGSHNCDFKDAIEILYALDDLITTLRVDAFKTPLNGLELSVTIPTRQAEQICSSVVSYLNQPPCFKQIDGDGLYLPYVEVPASQHKLKLYSPVTGALRLELKVDKMQFLGRHQLLTFADLVNPDLADSWRSRLLSAFHKIIWKCPILNPDTLLPEERDLYLRGRTYDYWQVSREWYASHTEFKCVEQQRSREKQDYNELVRRHCLHELPSELEAKMAEKLNQYIDLMHTDLYQTLLEICRQRWQYVGNLPLSARLPKHLELPPLSEIYPLYLCRFPTPPNRLKNQLHVGEALVDFDSNQNTKLIIPPNNLSASYYLHNGLELPSEELSQKKYREQMKARYRHYKYLVVKQSKSHDRMLYPDETLQRLTSVRARMAMKSSKVLSQNGTSYRTGTRAKLANSNQLEFFQNIVMVK